MARPRALENESFTLNWDEVELVPQPNDVTCWATAAAMVIGWRDRVSISPETIASIAGRTTASGLNPDQRRQFATEIGLTYEEPQSYSIDGFRTLLETNGPLWVAARTPLGNHAIVVTGMYSDGAADGSDSYVRVTDPWDRDAGKPGAPGAYLNTHSTGSRYILSWGDFQREYETRARTAADGTVNAQILHAGGTDGRTPNTGKPASYAQSLPERVRRTRAAALSAQAAIARAQETSATLPAPAGARRERNAWGSVSWELDQLDGFQLPADAVAATAPAVTEGRSVALADWPFVPGGDARTCLPLTLSWRYGEGAVGAVRIAAGQPEAAPGWALRVNGEIAPGPASRPAAVHVTLRYTFSAPNQPDVVAVTELALLGDGTYQRQDRWEQAQVTAAA
jgi:hypothetical protein